MSEKTRDNAPVFKSILIIGGGLIGTSVAHASRATGACDHIVMYDKDAAVRARLTEIGLADKVCNRLVEQTGQVDLVILAVPPGAMAAAASAIAQHLRPGQIVSDVGSVKESVMKQVEPLMPKGVVFIGGHPIAGTENSGPDAGFATLFEDRWCILTPHDESTEPAQKLKLFWECLGSRIAFMPADRHDMVLATTSHLPHLIAFALVGTATDMETVSNREIIKYSAGGFRDFTRIAASDPVMWRDVFLNNRDAVLDCLGWFIEDLTALKKAIRFGDGEKLLDEFTKTRDIRRKIIDAGQETPAPNFGRDEPHSEGDAES